MANHDVFETISTFEQWDRDYYPPPAIRYYDRAVPDMLAALKARPGETVLDAGCGPGVHSIRVAKAGHEVHAIDISATVLEEARRRAQVAGVQGRIRFQQGDLTNLGLPDASYDRVFCWGVVIHIPDVEKALSELVRVLKPGGRLALYVTNGDAWDYIFLRWARRVCGRPDAPLQSGPLGRGCWYDFQNGRLWVWRLAIGALTTHLESLGMRRCARIGGSLTEIHRRFTGVTRGMLLRLNNLYYRLHLPAGPCVANLLIFEKTGS